jgi:carbon-monoxide dehydrogenase medium subunit
LHAFDYFAPSSVEEAIALLSQNGAHARVLAGGTDLLVQMRQGRHKPKTIVDIKRIPELNRLDYDPAKGLSLGAAVPCIRIRNDPLVAAAYPALVDAVSLIGGIQIQGRATVGGNLCNAAPSGDAISAAIALDATCVVAGPNGMRSVPVAAFCTAPGQTVLENGELLITIQFPKARPNSGARHLRFTPRKEMDNAVAGAAAWVELSQSRRRIKDARIALATVAPVPLLAERAAASLIGKAPGDIPFAEAAGLATAVAAPRDSMRGTAAQRRHLIAVLVKRALREATSRAKGGQSNGS